MTHIDATGMDALESLANDLPREGVMLVVARLRTRMRDEFEAAGLIERIGVDRFFSSVGHAVTVCSGAPPPAVPALP